MTLCRNCYYRAKYALKSNKTQKPHEDTKNNSQWIYQNRINQHKGLKIHDETKYCNTDWYSL